MEEPTRVVGQVRVKLRKFVDQVAYERDEPYEVIEQVFDDLPPSPVIQESKDASN
jgi:hypothetical protein